MTKHVTPLSNRYNVNLQYRVIILAILLPHNAKTWDNFDVCATICAVVIILFVRAHSCPPDVDLASLLTPSSCLRLILFTHVLGHVPVNTCRTRHI